MEQPMEPKPLSERVSVLETRMDSVDRFFDRFEEHIQDEAAADIRIQVALTQVVDGLTATNNTLIDIKEQSADTASSVMRAQAMWKAVGIIAVVATTLVGGAWAVYQSNQTQKIEITK